MAAELLIAGGTATIDAVARAADVGKGTIYLHFPGREALLAALMRRERLALTEGLSGRGPGEVAGAAARELARRPLLTTVLRRGDLEAGPAPADEPLDPRGAAAGFAAYLAELQAAGLVRADRPPAELTAAVGAVLVGHLAVAGSPVGAPSGGVPELVADTVTRLLAREHPLDDAARAAMARATAEYLTRSRADAAAAYYETAGIDPPDER